MDGTSQHEHSQFPKGFFLALKLLSARILIQFEIQDFKNPRISNPGALTAKSSTAVTLENVSMGEDNSEGFGCTTTSDIFTREHVDTSKHCKA